MAESRVLVIDSDEPSALALSSILKFIDYSPAQVANIAELSLTGRRPQDWLAVIVGEQNDSESLASFIEWLKRDRYHPPILVSPHQRDAFCARHGIDSSACFALDRPVRYAQLNQLLRLAGLVRMNQALTATPHSGPTGNSAPIRRVRRMIEQVAAHETTVLVTGESGTGKEVVARAVHDRSDRRTHPFVAVNCGAIPSELLESELFGHEKGAFTGAITARKGRFEMAEGGTLFLDEIGDMTLPMQVKILRVLQERSYERVGSSRSLRSDVRIIAATHRNLEEAIVKGSFREDLYYRLNVFPIEMPSLRERLEDLPVLIEALTESMRSNGHGSVRLSAAVVHTLRGYHWPGNVRELSNLIERLAVLHPQGEVSVSDLPQRYRQNEPALPPVSTQVAAVEEEPEESVEAVFAAASAAGITMPAPVVQLLSDAHAPLPPHGLNLKDYIENIELALIRQALEQSSGVVAHAAKLLNTRRTTLVEKLRKYGLQREETLDAIERSQ